MRIRLVQIVSRVASVASVVAVASATAVLSPVPASAEAKAPEHAAAAPDEKAAAPKPPAKAPAEPLPPAPARVWLIAPSPKGPWTLRIDNEGERPMRIAADVRLLQLEIERVETDGQRGSVPQVVRRTKTTTTRCSVPSPLKPDGFPESRALLLAPGQSYVEDFDPRLLCFGKDASALTGGAVVKARLGWGPPPKWSRKPPAAPYIAQSTEDPPAFAPAQGLNAPAVVLSYGEPPAPAAGAAEEPAATPADTTAAPAADKAAATPADTTAAPAADKAAATPADTTALPEAHDSKPAEAPPPPIVDANAPRLELTAEPWSDAASRRSLVVRLKARNAGKRSMLVALRTRMLEFSVEGPSGTTVCRASPPTGAIPRDMYRTLKPGASVDLTLLLAETCPDDAFVREGLYRVTAALHANEPGTELGLNGYSAFVLAKKPTLVRLKSAPQPFYMTHARALPTSRLDDTGGE